MVYLEGRIGGCYTFLVLSVTVMESLSTISTGTRYSLLFLVLTTRPVQEPKIKVKITRKNGKVSNCQTR